MKLKPIDDELVSIVCYTANEIVKAHGWFTTVKEGDVRVILQAVRLVNDLIKSKKEEKKMWRPDGWVREQSIYFERNQPVSPYYKTREKDYESGANAILEALFKLAKESPTGTFIIDSREAYIYLGKDKK